MSDQKQISKPTEVIENKIYLSRGQRVLLDFHLADLYRVETKIWKRVVKRNIDRFPEDFMFEIIRVEYNSLRRTDLYQQTPSTNIIEADLVNCMIAGTIILYL